MPSTARSAGIGATGCPVPSSASMRWMTVSCAIRRIQNPTVRSGVYQEPAGSSGSRVANSSSSPAYARSSSASGSSAAGSCGGHGSGSAPSRMARVLCRYTSPTWRVRSATVQPGQLGTAAVGSVGTTARRRAKSAARQSRNRERSMPTVQHTSVEGVSPSGFAAEDYEVDGGRPPAAVGSEPHPSAAARARLRPRRDERARTGDNRTVGTRGTVVRRQTRLRWAAVAVAVVVLGALPIVIGRWPVRAAEVDPHRLRERISASTGQPFQGYAQSSGSLGLPPIPRLTEVTALLSGTTQLRAWYAGRDRWRVDVVAPGSERGLYRQPGAEYSWDYGDTLPPRIAGSLPVRLPRAAALPPPDLARRFLSAAAADPVTALPDRRVAGVAAVGLRIVPADPHTSVRSVDVWAAP